MEVKSLVPWPNKYCLMLKNCPYWALVHVREKEKLKNCISAVRKKEKKKVERRKMSHMKLYMSLSREKEQYIF